jgi:hypothetical protein
MLSDRCGASDANRVCVADAPNFPGAASGWGDDKIQPPVPMAAGNKGGLILAAADSNRAHQTCFGDCYVIAGVKL